MFRIHLQNIKKYICWTEIYICWTFRIFRIESCWVFILPCHKGVSSSFIACVRGTQRIWSSHNSALWVFVEKSLHILKSQKSEIFKCRDFYVRFFFAFPWFSCVILILSYAYCQPLRFSTKLNNSGFPFSEYWWRFLSVQQIHILNLPPSNCGKWSFFFWDSVKKNVQE